MHGQQNIKITSGCFQTYNVTLWLLSTNDATNGGGWTTVWSFQAKTRLSIGRQTLDFFRFDNS